MTENISIVRQMEYNMQTAIVKNNVGRMKAVYTTAVIGLLSSPAFAQDSGGANTATQIIAGVKAQLESGAAIAGAVVLGLFAIWGIKLLWRSK